LARWNYGSDAVLSLAESEALNSDRAIFCGMNRMCGNLLTPGRICCFSHRVSGALLLEGIAALNLINRSAC